MTVEQLLLITYVNGALTPSNIRLFLQSKHQSIISWISKNIDLSAAILIGSTKGKLNKEMELVQRPSWKG